jgi:hypothetical protein
MALKIAFVGYAAVIDETLSTREVIPVAVDANKFDSLAIGTFEDARSGLLFGLRIALGQCLQFGTSICA